MGIQTPNGFALDTPHSFDPCFAFSTHVMSPDGQDVAIVTVR